MKKMKLMIGVFVLVPFVLFAYFFSMAHSVSFPLVDIQGDRSILADVGYKIEMEVGASSIQIKNKDGISSHRNMYSTAAYLSNEQPEVSVSTNYWNSYTTTSYNYNDSCVDRRESIDKVDVTYLLEYNEAHGAIDYNQREIKTNLSIHSNEQRKIYKQQRECSGLVEEGSETIVIDEKELNATSINSFIIAKKNKEHVYYFMPPTDENIVGENNIYRIQLVKLKNGEEFATYVPKTKEIATLPSNRYYDSITTYNDKLYVISHYGEESYMSEYDIDGTLQRDVKIEYQGMQFKNIRSNENYDNTRYKIFIIGQDSYVFDYHEMKIIDHINLAKVLPNGGGATSMISDAYYKNNNLYLMYRDASKDNTWVDYSVAHILVLKDNKKIYEGIQTISYEQKEIEKEIILNYPSYEGFGEER